MTARTFLPLTIVGTTGEWDADLDTNFEKLRALIHDNAWPLYLDVGVGAGPDADPSANDAGILIWANDPIGPSAYYSDGAQWIRIVKNSFLTLPDSVAATVAVLKNDFNALLAALRLSGVIS